MPRVKAFIDTDVLTEAKKRIHHIFDIFDTVVVMFSGGKDSLAVLHLVREVMDEREQEGLALDVVFRDEELIPDEVINFVDHYRRQDWINMLWFCVPLASTKYVMGVCHSYVQWDEARRPDRWVRQPPSWAIRLHEGDCRVFDQYSMDAFTAQRYRGKIAFLTGIRAAESLIRFRSCVNKLNENYINGVPDPRAVNVKLCKPIFDWQEDDVFRYFYDRGIKYCPLYDLQMWSGGSMRVSTPLHAESAKQFDRIRATVPDFYQRVTNAFPEMLAHERYYKQMDKAAIAAQYGQTYEGVRLWIDENITDEKHHELATKRYDSVLARALQARDLYPPEYLLGAFMGGSYKREILPESEGEVVKDHSNEPVMNIQWLDAADLLGNSWNPNIVFSPELKLLERSILLTGFVQPILCTPNNLIIDGFHRTMLSKESAALKKRYAGKVPCAVLDVTRAQAMILTIRMNRAKGTHVAVRMSLIVRELIDEHNYDPQEVAIEIGATKDEVALLRQEGVFEMKNIKEYRYSRAWYPKEVAKA